MTERMQGRCLCGASAYECNGEVRFAIRCHCRDCQQISGGGHLPQVAVSAENFAATGNVRTYQLSAVSGNTVTVSFCGDCGSPLFKSTSKMPDVQFLCAGSLDCDPVTDPFQRVFEDSRRSWDF